MRATYRRPRRPDPLASTHAVRRVLDQLRTALPHLIPRAEGPLRRLLRAVRHVERYQATDTKRGRPGGWQRPQLLQVGECLREILARETSAGIGVGSFVDHYLRLLEFPVEVLGALSGGEINLFEAEQLARTITRDNIPLI